MYTCFFTCVTLIYKFCWYMSNDASYLQIHWSSPCPPSSAPVRSCAMHRHRTGRRTWGTSLWASLGRSTIFMVRKNHVKLLDDWESPQYGELGNYSYYEYSWIGRIYIYIYIYVYMYIHMYMYVYVCVCA